MAGNALAFEVTADSVGFDAAFKRMEKNATGFGNKLSSDLKHLVGSVASYEAFKGLVGKTVEATVEIRNFGKQARITTDEVQQIQKAASKTGLEFEDFQAGLSKLGVARQAAAKSDQKLLDFFNKWGISLDDLENPQLRNIDLLKKMSAAMQGVTLTSAQATEFREVFGRAGEKMITSIQELARLGPIKIIDEKDIEAIYEADRAMAKLNKQWKVFIAPFIGGAARTLSEIIGGEGEELPFEAIQKKILKGQIPSLAEILRFAAQTLITGADPGSHKANVGRNLQALADQFDFGEGPIEGKALPFSKGKTGRDLVREEQMRRMYDFLDKQIELEEHIRKINFDMLSPKEQQLDLQRRINEKLAEASAQEKMGNEREGRSKRIEAATLNEQLLNAGGIKPLVPGLDTASAAGLKIGGAVNFNPAAVGREQIDLLRQVRDNTAKLAVFNEVLRQRAWASIYAD